MSDNDKASGVRPPTRQLRLRVEYVPVEEGMTVRWLANPVGILVHGANLRIACTGSRFCKECQTYKKAVWKGFAPVEIWVESTAGDYWLPAVLEVSDRLSEYLGDEPMRGQVWYLYRQKTDAKYKECAGHKVDDISPSELSTAFDVEAVVTRCYNSPRIVFGVEKPLRNRPIIAPVVDSYKPPTATPRAPTAAQMLAKAASDAAAVKAQLAADPVYAAFKRSNEKDGAK